MKQNTPTTLYIDAVWKAVENMSSKAFNYKELAAGIQATTVDEKTMIKNILDTFAKQGKLKSTGNGKYHYTEEVVSKQLTGKVDMTSSGSAYIICDDGSPDVYIPAAYINNALHQDKIIFSLSPNRSSKIRKPEGKIVKVTQRAKDSFVGVLHLQKKFAFVVPDSARMNVDIMVSLENILHAKAGEKVVVQITSWGTATDDYVGKVVKVLGEVGSHKAEMGGIMEEFKLPEEFPQDVIDFAAAIPEILPQAEIAKRKDYRNILTFTIDPIDAKDFDDAISYQLLPNGNYEIGVHIADVSYYMPENSILDKEAYKRATSVYLVDRVVHMLPERLAGGVCSLRPLEDKLCFAAIFEITPQAEVVSEWIGRTVIHSNHRFTYEEAQEVLETKKGKYVAELMILDTIAKILRNQRYVNGSINFHSQEVKFVLDEQGNPIQVVIKESKDAHQLIEDFMLLANQSVATFIGKAKGKDNPSKTFVYRIHDTPDENKLIEFNNFVKTLGYTGIQIDNKNVLAKSMNKLLDTLKDKPEESVIASLAVRSMAKASYSIHNIGHYGLGFAYYSHFTSPIRRYPDVMTHRLLAHYLDGGKDVKNPEHLEEQCKHSSAQERKATDAERASIKYKQVQFMQGHMDTPHQAIITGINDRGFYVEIISNKCEGMIKIDTLPKDFYQFDKERLEIVGQRTKLKFRLGDVLTIKVRRIDVMKKLIDFELGEV